MLSEIAVIGGGLAGLALADALHRQGADWMLFEARARLGGRVRSPALGKWRVPVDLGPAWLWPQNRRICAAAERFGLTVFPQHVAGLLVYQDETGGVRRDIDLATMAGALRIEGGAGALTDALAHALPAERIALSEPLNGVSRDGEGWRLRFATGREAQASRIAFAMPPRLVADVAIEPVAPQRTRAALAAIPTWMAAQAKVAAIYPRPFWREAGLSGDAISRCGPLVEIHDASPADASAGVLFGFVGAPAQRRAGQGDGLRRAAVAQLGALFGPEAAAPESAHLHDWAESRFTTAASDLAAPGGHPSGGAPQEWGALEAEGLLLAGAETARDQPGLMEGALAAAEDAAARLLR